MNRNSLILLVTLLLLTAGCKHGEEKAVRSSPHEGNLFGDSFVPGPDGKPALVPVVAYGPPPLPESGPIALTREQCLERARIVGRLDGESVPYWRLDRKVTDLSFNPIDAPANLETLRMSLDLEDAAWVPRANYRIARLQFDQKMDRLLLATDRGFWTLHFATRSLAERDTPESRTRTEDARARLADLLGLTSAEGERLTITESSPPALPDDLASALRAAATIQPPIELARIREEMLRRTRHFGDPDTMIENRQRWFRAQQAREDVIVTMANEAERLLRKLAQAKRLAEAQPGREAELALILAGVDVAHWLSGARPPATNLEIR